MNRTRITDPKVPSWRPKLWSDHAPWMKVARNRLGHDIGERMADDLRRRLERQGRQRDRTPEDQGVSMFTPSPAAEPTLRIRVDDHRIVDPPEPPGGSWDR